MGIPGFYRTIFRRYTTSEGVDGIYKFISSNPRVDYFYIDFNPIIYISLHRLQSANLLKGQSNDEVDARIIQQTVEMAAEIINEMVKPKKMVYIAIDGPAPKCKIVTQRARRYKAIVENKIKQHIKQAYPEDSTVKDDWEKANITPGTKFMAKLDKALYNAIANGKIDCPKIIFNGSSIASEGEHKIVQHLKQLSHSPEETVCVYSNDGDMAFLTLQFPEKKMITMIDSNFLPSDIQKQCESDYVYFNNNKFHQVLIEDMFEPIEDRRRRQSEKSEKSEKSDDKLSEEPELPKSPKLKKRKYTHHQQSIDRPPSLDPKKYYDSKRILIDFMFLLFLGGNDFVRPLPFAKIRNNGVYRMFLKVYMFTLRKTKSTSQYLIRRDGTVNSRFFSDVIYGLSLQEPRRMMSQSQYLQKILQRDADWGPFDNWEEEWQQFQHTPYSSPGHPEHELVRDALLNRKYSDIKHHQQLKKEYYKVNFGIDSNDRNYNSEIAKICRTYIKSLLFTLKYYLAGQPPSWRWSYPYEVSPWPSDISFAMRRTDLSRLDNFTKSYPYTSQQQLLLTVPITSNVFPEEYRVLRGLLPTIKHDLDRINGEKYIYAEPVLSIFNENRLLYEARKIKLLPDTYKRNQLATKTMVFNRK